MCACRRNGHYGVSIMLKYSLSLPRKQYGYNLVELMVGIAVGLIILAGAIAVFAKLSFAGLENVRATRLNEQMRGSLNLITRELQRSGYANAWAAGSANVLGLDTELMGLFGTVTLGGSCADSDGDGANECDCVLYSYDLNDSAKQGVGGAGTLGAGGVDAALQDNTNFELFGFRLNAGALEMRTAGDSGSYTCAGGTWRDISDDDVSITALTFEAAPGDSSSSEVYGGNGDAVQDSGEVWLLRRKINVVLSGELATDSAVTVELRDEVKIKNDHYYTVP